MRLALEDFVETRSHTRQSTPEARKLLRELASNSAVSRAVYERFQRAALRQTIMSALGKFY